MKNLKNISLAVFATVAFASCSNDDNNNPVVQLPPSSQAFQSIRQIALQHQTQSFTATAGTGVITLTSAKGVTITLAVIVPQFQTSNATNVKKINIFAL